MSKYLKKFRKLNIWLLISTSVVLLFYIFRGNSSLMNFIVDNITNPIKNLLMSISYIFPFSLAELSIFIFATTALILLVVAIVRIIRGNRLQILYVMFITTLSLAMTVYGTLNIMFGINYYADSFQDKSGIHAAGSTVEELYALTVYFADNASEYGNKVQRNTEGVFAVSQDTYFGDSTEIYYAIEAQFPFLSQTARVPKKLLTSKLLSYTHFTGFYFPLTGEANINSDSPDCFIPFTIAHEMAHQRGVMSENEANLVGILACITSENTSYAYSGFIAGYTYLSNALYSGDYDLWMDARGHLSEGCLADLAYNSSYWKKHETKVTEISQDVYDSLLKNYGNKAGTQSYGEVVDLLTAYYKLG